MITIEAVISLCAVESSLLKCSYNVLVCPVLPTLRMNLG